MKKVMNNLNSVLIEGAVSGGLTMVKTGKEVCCSFAVSSLRYFKDGKRIEEQETRIGVMVRGIKLVEAAVIKARDGRGVRVVGRLANTEKGGGVYIEADHIEYRPEPESKEE
jgi:single-stranded DNA-binding protein